MKPLAKFLLLLLTPLSLWAAGSPPIEFNGVLIEGGKTSVSLLDLNTGVAKWVVVGGKFEGYTVKAYVPDPRGADAVELTRSGAAQVLRVGLKNAVILPTPAAPPVFFMVDDLGDSKKQPTIPNTVNPAIKIPAENYVDEVPPAPQVQRRDK